MPTDKKIVSRSSKQEQVSSSTKQISNGTRVKDVSSSTSAFIASERGLEGTKLGHQIISTDISIDGSKDSNKEKKSNNLIDSYSKTVSKTADSDKENSEHVKMIGSKIVKVKQGGSSGSTAGVRTVSATSVTEDNLTKTQKSSTVKSSQVVTSRSVKSTVSEKDTKAKKYIIKKVFNEKGEEIDSVTEEVDIDIAPEIFSGTTTHFETTGGSQVMIQNGSTLQSSQSISSEKYMSNNQMGQNNKVSQSEELQNLGGASSMELRQREIRQNVSSDVKSHDSRIRQSEHHSGIQQVSASESENYNVKLIGSKIIRTGSNMSGKNVKKDKSITDQKLTTDSKLTDNLTELVNPTDHQDNTKFQLADQQIVSSDMTTVSNAHIMNRQNQQNSMSKQEMTSTSSSVMKSHSSSVSNVRSEAHTESNVKLIGSKLVTDARTSQNNIQLTGQQMVSSDMTGVSGAHIMNTHQQNSMNKHEMTSTSSSVKKSHSSSVSSNVRSEVRSESNVKLVGSKLVKNEQSSQNSTQVSSSSKTKKNAKQDVSESLQQFEDHSSSEYRIMGSEKSHDRKEAVDITKSKIESDESLQSFENEDQRTNTFQDKTDKQTAIKSSQSKEIFSSVQSNLHKTSSNQVVNFEHTNYSTDKSKDEFKQGNRTFTPENMNITEPTNTIETSHDSFSGLNTGKETFKKEYNSSQNIRMIGGKIIKTTNFPSDISTNSRTSGGFTESHRVEHSSNVNIFSGTTSHSSKTIDSKTSGSRKMIYDDSQSKTISQDIGDENLTFSSSHISSSRNDFASKHQSSVTTSISENRVTEEASSVKISDSKNYGKFTDVSTTMTRQVGGTTTTRMIRDDKRSFDSKISSTDITDTVQDITQKSTSTTSKADKMIGSKIVKTSTIEATNTNDDESFDDRKVVTIRGVDIQDVTNEIQRTEKNIDEKSQTIKNKISDTKVIREKTETKERCICEICTCGRHHCKHGFVQEPLFQPKPLEDTKPLSHEEFKPYALDQVDRPVIRRQETVLKIPDGPLDTTTAYRNEFVPRESVPRPTK